MNVEEMTIEKAAEFIGEMDAKVAGEIISKLGTLTGADIIEELPVRQAGNIMEKVEPKAGGAIMGEVVSDTRIGLFNVLSEESLTDLLSSTPVEAHLELPLQTLFDRLPKVPASSLAVTDPPPVDPNLLPPVATQVSPTLGIYESQTGELTWATLVESPDET